MKRIILAGLVLTAACTHVEIAAPITNSDVAISTGTGFNNEPNRDLPDLNLDDDKPEAEPKE